MSVPDIAEHARMRIRGQRIGHMSCQYRTLRSMRVGGYQGSRSLAQPRMVLLGSVRLCAPYAASVLHTMLRQYCRSAHCVHHTLPQYCTLCAPHAVSVLHTAAQRSRRLVAA
eukprot:1935651-Rhodomonas_salina.1